jgi:glycosyltransferase involved in cell wall biosynthesis
VNILILSPYPPYPPYGGGTMRIYQIIRGLAARHAVTCVTFAPDAAAEQALAPLHAICRLLVVRGPLPRSPLRRAWTTLMSPLPDMALRNASHAYSKLLRHVLHDERFDIVQAESVEMAGYLRMLRAEFNASSSAHNSKLKRPEGTQNSKLVLDQFNAEFVLQRRAFLTDLQRPRRWHAAGYSLAQWLKLARYERRVMRQCDAVVAVSEEDRCTLRRLTPIVPIGVIPNGVDTAHFSRAAVAHERAGPFALHNATLVFSGTLDFRPNIDAVTWFVREALPRIQAHQPDVRLVVVGRRPAPALRALAAAGALTLTGEVPDARPYIAGAAAYIVPMRIGGGVRLKLLEALALEAPVVSTSMGAEGAAGLRGGEHCLLADDPAEFAGAVLRLLGDPALGRQLGAAGRVLVRRHYDWSAIVPQLEVLHAQLCGLKTGD